MGVNKVNYYDRTLIDISDSTVTPETLAEGATAYDKSGEKITGTMKASEDLTAVLDAQESKLNTLVESLEGKAAGGGSVGTCTVNFDDNTGGIGNVYFTVFEDGEIKPKIMTDLADNVATDIENVVCGSLIAVACVPELIKIGTIQSENVDLIASDSNSNASSLAFRAPTEGGSIGYIKISA